MNKQLFWKELRVHGWVVAFWPVATAGLFLLIVMIARMNNSERDLAFILPSLGICLLWAHGILVGSLLGANDTENKTHHYLDTLPISRGRRMLHWIPAGLVMQLPMLIACCVLVAYLEKESAPIRPPLFLMAVIASLLGLTWGTLGGIMSKTVLGAFGLGIAMQVLASALLWIIGFAITLVPPLLWNTPASRQLRESEWGKSILVMVFLGILVIAPALVAWYLFTRPDRNSKPVNEQASGIRFHWRIVWFRFRREILVSLAWQFPLAILMGFLLPSGPVCWPLWSLFIGAWWGGLALRQDQRDGVLTWWGAMRAPMGRYLFGIHLLLFSIGMMLLLITMIPNLTQLASKASTHRDIGEIFLRQPMGWPGWFTLVPVLPWFFLWYAHAFGAAMWLVMCFRKPIISLIAAFCLAGLLSLAWIPSLVSGDLSLLVVMVVPALLARCSFIRLGEWYAGRLPLPDIGVLLIPLLIPLFLWLRMHSIQEPEDLLELKSLRQEIINNCDLPEAMRLQGAVRGFAHSGKSLYETGILNDFIALVNPEENQPANNKPALLRLPANKKPAPLHQEDTALLFKTMHENFSSIPITKEPMMATREILPTTTETLKFESTLHLGVKCESLYAQMELKQGNAGSAIQSLERIICLSRNFMHLNSPMFAQYGEIMEKEGVKLCGIIATARGITAGDLEKLANILADHQEQKKKVRLLSAAQAGCLVSLDALENPLTWFLEAFHPGMNSMRVQDAMWWHFVANCWHLPWEKELLRRRILQWFNKDLQSFPGHGGFHNKNNIPFYYDVDFRLRLRDAGKPQAALIGLEQARVALLRYFLDEKHWPATWDKLCPKYLPEPIMDPYSGSPLRWRISVGEEIENFKKPLKAPAGSLVLWSVGEDERDDGGIRHEENFGFKPNLDSIQGYDLIRVLPVPGK